MHHLLVQTNKLNNGDLRNKMPNKESLPTGKFNASNRSEVSSGPDLNASQSSPSSLEGRWAVS